MTPDWCNVGQMTIDTLADDVLLYVFDFYLAETSDVEAWHTLAHVCQRWRILVFRSPRRLNLQIACTDETQVREKLDVWPALPIVISGKCNSQTCHDNIIAILEHHDRVCQIELSLMWELEDIFEALEEPFPELTVLKLHSTQTPDPIFSYSGQHLGGTTHLRSLSLTCIPIFGLQNLLLSSTDLIDLRLMEIPISVFNSPDEMVTALSALTRLQILHLGPEFDEFHPDWENRRLPLPTRTVLPSLIELKFEGVIEYLDDFMARIDTPLLNHLDIVVSFHLNRVIVLNAPQILRFISHIPKFQEALSEAHIGIDSDKFKIWINFLSTRTSSYALKLKILCIEPEWQFPLLAQFCRSPFFPFPTLEYLYIDGGTYSRQRWRENTENTGWLELLQPFSSAKNLYLTKNFALRIAPALEELGGEMVTEVLPALENVFIEKFQLYGPVYKAFRNFAATRQLSSHPIVISDWDRTGREVDMDIDD
jgi:hypothetical protein